MNTFKLSLQKGGHQLYLSNYYYCPEIFDAVFKFCLERNYSFVIKRSPARVNKFDLVILTSEQLYNAQLDIPKSSGRNIGSSKLLRWLGAKTIAVVGPDGSGKTTLIDAVVNSDLVSEYRFKRFKRYFRRVLPYIFRHEDRNDREQKLLWLILPISWLTFFLGSTFFRAGRPTILDRYFYDYFLRQSNDRSNGTTKIRNYGLWTVITPRPNKLVVAMCAPEIIHERKNEMSIDTINKVYKVYLDQVVSGKLSSVLFCNTGIDQSISCQQVIDYLR